MYKRSAGFQTSSRRCILSCQDGKANSQKKQVLKERVFSGFCAWDGKEALAALLFGCPKYLECVKQGGKKGKEKKNLARNGQGSNVFATRK